MFNAFAAKLTADGAGFAYSTFLGGSDLDFGLGVAAGSDGGVYVAGATASVDYPTGVPLQAENAGDLDGAVTKLDGTGCTPPGAVGNSLKMAKLTTGEVVVRWTDIPVATSYDVFHGSDRAGPFPVWFGTAASGAVGLQEPLPSEPRLFFRVAGANACGFGPL